MQKVKGVCSQEFHIPFKDGSLGLQNAEGLYKSMFISRPGHESME